jgi:anti-sigma factor RsiW
VTRIPFGVSHSLRLDGLSCATAEGRAYELLDGELGDAASTELFAHLQHCSHCRVRFNRTSRFLAALRRQRRVSAHAPAALRARLRVLLAMSGGAVASAPADRTPRD